MTVKHPVPPFSGQLKGTVFFRTADLGPDSFYPAHRHAWGEFLYSFSGVMEVTPSGRHFLIQPHFGLWMPPGVEHAGATRERAEHCSLYIAPQLCHSLPSTTCTLAVGPLARAILEELRRRKVGMPANSQQGRLMRVLVDELSSATQQGTYLPMSSDEALGPVLRALYANPQDERTLAEWACQTHTTQRTLARRCVRDLGIGFAEWRRRLRVVKAIALLEEGTSVEATALQLGYSSSSSFIAMFHRMMGVSPDEYRKRTCAGTASRA